MDTIAKVRLASRDSYRDWPAHFTAPPDGFDRDAYQQRIDEIAGKSRGRSILRLEWGGEEKITRYSSWDSSGAPRTEETLPKYRVRRRSALGRIEYVPMRRWVIAQLYEWEQYGYGDDDQTTFTDESGRVCKAFEKEKDYYTPLIYVGDHSRCPKDCCEDKLCMGDAKNPDGAELFWMLEKTYLLSNERIVDPRRQMSPMDTKKISIEIDAKKVDHSQELDQRLEEIHL